MIEDPRDIEDFITGKGIVYGENEDGEVIELHINNSADYQHVANEELKEADKVIATYIKKYGPQEDIDPTKPIRIDNE